MDCTSKYLNIHTYVYIKMEMHIFVSTYSKRTYICIYIQSFDLFYIFEKQTTSKLKIVTVRFKKTNTWHKNELCFLIEMCGHNLKMRQIEIEKKMTKVIINVTDFF